MITLNENHQFQFTTDEFVEINAATGKVIEAHRVSRIYYVITCKTDQGKPRVCSSSEAPPTSASVETTAASDSMHNNRKSQYYKRAFSAIAEFSGAAEIDGIGLSSRLREYQLPILTERRSDGYPYALSLPAVKIDGRLVQLPDVQVSRVSESVCRYRAW